MAIAGLALFYHQELLVKITDQDAKNNKFKSIKYWKLGFYCLNGTCFFLVRYMLPATMKMEFFGKECARHFVDEGFLCNYRGISCGSCYFISNWTGNKMLWLSCKNQVREQEQTCAGQQE
jgi:hypothetical protein